MSNNIELFKDLKDHKGWLLLERWILNEISISDAALLSCDLPLVPAYRARSNALRAVISKVIEECKINSTREFYENFLNRYGQEEEDY